MSEKPKRVLYLNHGAKPSGAEIALLRLLGALDRAKVHPVMVFGEDGPMVQAMRDINVETHVLPLAAEVGETRKDTLKLGALFSLGKFASVSAYAGKIAAFARRNSIDIVHTNTIKAHCYGGVAARLAGIPLVWHVRDFVNQSYFPATAVHVFRALARLLPSHIVTVSGGVMEQLHLGRRNAYSTVVMDGLTDAELVPRADAFAGPHRPVRIGIVGRISEWKGQHVFIEAASKVIKRGHDAEFMLVGAPLFGEQAYLDGLHKQVEDLGISSRVQFLGFRKDVPAVMREIDILVHASTSGEPFGQVIIEGMAAGKPVIASRGGGVPEIITDDENGLMTPMGDAEALAAALVSLIENPAKAQRLARAGYEHVRHTFTAAEGARKIECIYDAIGGVVSSSRNYTSVSEKAYV